MRSPFKSAKRRHLEAKPNLQFKFGIQIVVGGDCEEERGLELEMLIPAGNIIWGWSFGVHWIFIKVTGIQM